MKVHVVYGSGKVFGTGTNAKVYDATVQTGDHAVQLGFDFRPAVPGASWDPMSDAEVKSASVTLRRSDALAIARAILLSDEMNGAQGLTLTVDESAAGQPELKHSSNGLRFLISLD